MFILRMLLEIVVMIILCVIVGFVVIKIIFKKKGKKKLSIKKVKTVVFDVIKVKEDEAIPAIKGKN